MYWSINPSSDISYHFPTLFDSSLQNEYSTYRVNAKNNKSRDVHLLPSIVIQSFVVLRLISHLEKENAFADIIHQDISKQTCNNIIYHNILMYQIFGHDKR